MTIKKRELVLYGSANMPTDDVSTPTGGAIDKSKRVACSPIGGPAQVVSSDAGDTVDVTINYLLTDFSIGTETKALNGQTPVLFVNADIVYTFFASNPNTPAGDVAIEAQTEEFQDVIVSDDGEAFVLPSGASALDDAYNWMVARVVAGTGAGQINLLIDYVGSMKKAYYAQAWVTPLDNTSEVRIARGLFLPAGPTQCEEIHVPGYGISGDPDDLGSTKTFYEKMFLCNESAETLSNSEVRLTTNPSSLFAFGIGSALNDTVDNASDRTTAPGGVTFNTANKSVPGGGGLDAGDAIAVWLKTVIPPGTVRNKVVARIGLFGETV